MYVGIVFNNQKNLTQKFAWHFFRIDLHYWMKILYPNLNMLDIRCDSKDNRKGGVAAFPLRSL